MNKDNDETDITGTSEAIKERRYWIIGVISLLIMMIMYYFGIRYFFHEPLFAGTFGDSFGAMGSFISGVALIGVIVTMRIQQIQMSQQNTQIEYQNRQIEKQNNQIAEQNKYLLRGEINDTFFKLLGQIKEIKKDMSWSVSDGEKLIDIYKELKTDFEKSPQVKSVEIFQKFYDTHRVEFDNYFRTLIYMLRYLNDHHIDFEEKRVYSNLLRAQLSQEEAALIYYNMEDRTSRNKGLLQEYIQKYNLLADLKDWVDLHEPHVERINDFVMSCKQAKK